MIHSTVRRIGLLLVASVAIPTLAQESSLEVVEVTARKKSESTQTTPLSITAFSEKTIQEADLIDIRRVAELTPGLQFSGDFGRAAERPVIRGISNLRPETAQPVSLFIDGVYVRTGLISSITEGVERIEVLKGPQAAIYGRSTYGGVVNYITRAPGDELEATVSATGGEHDRFELNGLVSGPISPTLSGMIGYRHYEFGGEFDNVAPLSTDARRVGEEQTDAFFGALHFEPNDQLSIIGRAYFSTDEDGQFSGALRDSLNNNSSAAGGTGCPSNVGISYYCGIATPSDFVNISTSIDQGQAVPVSGLAFPVTAQWDFRAGLDRDITRFTTSISYDFNNNINLTWLSGYTEEESQIVTNQSYSPTLVGNSFGSFPSAWVTDDITERDYFSHELRLSGSRGDIDWLVGAFVYGEDLNVIDRNILQADYQFDQNRTDDEISVFARVGWQASDQLALSLEGRQSKEDIESLAVEDGTPLSTDFSSFNPRFTAEYTLANGTFLYGNIARGSKAGGFNAVNPNDPVEAPFLSFDEEVVWQYEIGAKTTFANGRMRLNAALFYLDLQDQQLSQVVILNEGTPEQVQITVVQNVGESEVQGIELDYAWQISDRWFASANYALADTDITQGTDATQGTILGDTSLVGFDIPRVSEHAATASIQYTRPLSNNWELKTRLDGIYNSSRYAQIHNLQETGDQFDVNLRASIGNERFDATLWTRNLLDDDAVANVFRYVDPGDFRFFRRAYVSFLAPGRQTGITFRYRF